jgi:hypothetical protein
MMRKQQRRQQNHRFVKVPCRIPSGSPLLRQNTVMYFSVGMKGEEGMHRMVSNSMPKQWNLEMDMQWGCDFSLHVH